MHPACNKNNIKNKMYFNNIFLNKTLNYLQALMTFKERKKERTHYESYNFLHQLNC